MRRLLALALVGLLSSAAPALAAQCQPIGGTAAAFAEANKFRARNGAEPLTENAALRKAALSYACDMASRGYFAHHSPEGVGVTGRAAQVGFKGRCVGENIARSINVILSAGSAMQQWEQSAGHRAQLLAQRYDIAGLAGVRVGETSYWVMIFGGCTGSIFESFP